MSVKEGQIVEIESPPFGDWCRVTLHTGQRVYVHRAMLAQMPADFDPDTWLVFVERGRLGQTVWMGESKGVAGAVAAGLLTPAEAMEGGFHADGSFPTADEIGDLIRRGIIGR